MAAVVKVAQARAFAKFIAARERHRIAKEGGRKIDKPDPIISQYRFCNVRRNDDRVTKWIHENYMSPSIWRSDPNLWFALVVARLFNNEDALGSEFGIYRHVLPFNPEKMRMVLKLRAGMGQKNFNAAYIVSTAGAKMDKVDYVIDRILVPAWEMRKFMSNLIATASELEYVHEALMGLNGLASFMAAQVVADLKYAEPSRWEDFDFFVASGPGSRRGLNRLLERDKDAPMREADFRETLLLLRHSVNRQLYSMKPITAQDIQNCLCEYDKYERARTGEGRPKQLYTPKEN